jgi:hypothetical protein
VDLEFEADAYVYRRKERAVGATGGRR